MRVRQPESRSSRGLQLAAQPRSRAFPGQPDTGPISRKATPMGPIDPAPPDLAGTPGEGAAFFAPNYWPETPRGHGGGVSSTIYLTMAALARRDVHSWGCFCLSPCIATALEAEGLETSIDPLSVIHSSTMRGIPTIRRSSGPVEVPATCAPGRATPTTGNAHESCAATTCPAGCKVRPPRRRWIDVAPPEDGLRLQHRRTDDALDQRPHGRRTSTGWRSRPGIPDTSRLSLVFFHNPSADALIEWPHGPSDRGLRGTRGRFGRHLSRQTSEGQTRSRQDRPLGPAPRTTGPVAGRARAAPGRSCRRDSPRV